MFPTQASACRRFWGGNDFQSRKWPPLPVRSAMNSCAPWPGECRSANRVEAMAKAKTTHTCTECGGQTLKWQGQCPHCTAWNTLVETAAEVGGKAGMHRFASLAGTSAVVTLGEVEARD